MAWLIRELSILKILRKEFFLLTGSRNLHLIQTCYSNTGLKEAATCVVGVTCGGGEGGEGVQHATIKF